MNNTLKTIFTISGLILLGILCWYLRVLILFFIISAVISVIAAPVVAFIKKAKVGKKRISDGIAAFITLIGIFSIFGGIFFLIIPLVAEQATIISHLDTNEIVQSLQGKIVIVENWLANYNIDTGDVSNQAYIVDKLKSTIDFGWISNLFDNIFTVFGDVFVAVFSIMFISFFLLKDGDLLTQIMYSLAPDKHLSKIKSIKESSDKMLTSYLTGVLIQVLITTTVISVGLFVIGVKNALIIGVIAGFMNVIPYIGPIFGMVIGLFVAISTSLSIGADVSILALSGKVLIVFGIAQLVDNFFTQPVILSKSVNAHPLEIFLVISAAATLFGVGGMILAIPTYTIIKIVAGEFLSKYKFVKSLTKP